MKPLAIMNQEHARYAFGINNGKDAFSLLNWQERFQQHLLESAHFAGKDNKKVTSQVSLHRKYALPLVTEGQTQPQPSLFFCMWDHLVRQHIMLTFFYVWIHVLLMCFSQELSASPARTRAPPVNILAKVSLFGSGAINDSRCPRKSRKPGHRGRLWPNYWQLLEPRFSAF